MKKFLKLFKRVFQLWLLYAAIGLIILPLYHKPSAYGGNIVGKVGNATGQERVLSIDTNMDALLWRLRLIHEAKEQIVLVTFDFRDDNSGQDIMSALLNAADRGVEVQILVDGLNGSLWLPVSGNFRELAAHENVEVRLYNPVNLLVPWKINYRMHDKYLIADDFAYILGGRNTDDLFLGNYAESCNEDRDILVYETVPGEGNSYIELQEYFEYIWKLPCCKPIKWRARGEACLREYYQEVKTKYPEAFTEVEWEKATIETERIKLYTNLAEPENKPPVLWDRLAEEMKQGEDVLIQTPYIICSRTMYQDLNEICAENPKTELIINAVECGSNPFGCTDYLNQKRKVQRTGICTYEYLGEQALHTKTILIGDHTSIVGSCNMDMRSVYLDTEMMLVIDSRELNASLWEQTEILKQRSRMVFPDGMTIAGEDYQETKQGVGKTVFYQILRVVIIPFRHLL